VRFSKVGLGIVTGIPFGGRFTEPNDEREFPDTGVDDNSRSNEDPPWPLGRAGCKPFWFTPGRNGQADPTGEFVAVAFMRQFV